MKAVLRFNVKQEQNNVKNITQVENGVLEKKCAV